MKKSCVSFILWNVTKRTSCGKSIESLFRPRGGVRGGLTREVAVVGGGRCGGGGRPRAERLEALRRLRPQGLPPQDISLFARSGLQGELEARGRLPPELAPARPQQPRYPSLPGICTNTRPSRRFQGEFRLWFLNGLPEIYCRVYASFRNIAPSEHTFELTYK